MSLHTKYSIEADVTKPFRLKFVDQSDASMSDSSVALKVVEYTWVLHITDLNDTFIMLIHVNSTEIGILQTPYQHFIFVSRSAAAHVQLHTGYSIVTYDKVVFK